MYQQMDKEKYSKRMLEDDLFASPPPTDSSEVFVLQQEWETDVKPCKV